MCLCKYMCMWVQKAHGEARSIGSPPPSNCPCRQLGGTWCRDRFLGSSARTVFRDPGPNACWAKILPLDISSALRFLLPLFFFKVTYKELRRLLWIKCATWSQTLLFRIQSNFLFLTVLLIWSGIWNNNYISNSLNSPTSFSSLISYMIPLVLQVFLIDQCSRFFYAVKSFP